MDSVSNVGVLDKAVASSCVPSSRAARSDLAELQAATGLPRATCHRLAVALETHGLLRRDARRAVLPRLRAGRRSARAAADAFPLAERRPPGA